ncbi:MAG: TonB-dependent receptor, partial [Xanthomonadales bacterium]|nr:TonB-dependent receptor [Xanthomonadales bacterium]
EALAFIRSPEYLNTTSRQQWLAAAVVTGAPFEIWSGPVDMAFGIEYRSDDAEFVADPLLFSGDAVGFRPDSSIAGKETVYELYAEAAATLWQSDRSDQKLDLEIGARWSDYDNAGSVTTWKAGLDWRVNNSLRFRSMLQHAVRAPNNAELFLEQVIEEGQFVGNNSEDPCSASQDPVGRGNADKCILQGLAPSQLGVFEATRFYPTTNIFGGNPNLEPESSDTFTLGFVVSPANIPELTIAVDYWDIEITDTIGSISPRVLCFDPLNTQGLFCDNIRRDETGNVAEVSSTLQNRGILATDGIDVQLQYGRDLPTWMAAFDDWAELSVNATLTHIMSLRTQENPISQVFECEGTFGFPCGGGGNLFGAETIPENRMTANINYASGPFTAHLTWRWIDGTDNAAPIGLPLFGITEFTLAIPDIPAWNYFDLGLGYEWNDRLTMRFGVNNLFDKESPFMADWTWVNTDSQMYDVFGRTYYLNFRYQVTGD